MNVNYGGVSRYFLKTWSKSKLNRTWIRNSTRHASWIILALRSKGQVHNNLGQNSRGKALFISYEFDLHLTFDHDNYMVKNCFSSKSYNSFKLYLIFMWLTCWVSNRCIKVVLLNGVIAFTFNLCSKKLLSTFFGHPVFNKIKKK